MAKIIGIDLGTTNSCVSVIEGGKPFVIANKEGSRTTPSIVAFTEKGERLVGQIAKRQAITNPQNTLYAVKRLIGRKFDSDEVQKVMKLLPYKLTETQNGDARIKVRDREYSPPEISAIVLQRMREIAEEHLGEKVEEAIITVPAYFDDSQRNATKDAGKIAGLNVLRIINEPTAAALAYGMDQRKNQKIAVYDLGGGTFDISILEIGDGVFEVLATNGDTLLGGEDLDQKIIDWLVREFMEKTKIDLRSDRMALQRLKEASEKAKIELSSVETTEINLPFISADATGPKHLTTTLTRAKFEELVKDVIDRTVEPCLKAMKDAAMSPDKLDEIILVGGQTRTPRVIEIVREIFKKEPNRDKNPDEVVAVGAAIQGGILQGDIKDLILLDVTPLSLGIETHGGMFTKVIERNSTIPIKKTMVFSTVTDNQGKVEVHVLQGEREVAAHNKSLAKFELVGIPPAPRGVPQIDVTFEVDSNGIVHVSAKDQASGREQAIRITASSGLSEDEIKGIIEDASKHAEEDRQRKEKQLQQNKLEGLLYTNERVFQEVGRFLKKEELPGIRDTLKKSRQVLQEGTLAEMNNAIVMLQVVGQQLTDAMLFGAGKPADEGVMDTGAAPTGPGARKPGT
ncbi:MAG: molecular chaperone DnaK [Acidobacteriota bacterium]